MGVILAMDDRSTVTLITTLFTELRNLRKRLKVKKIDKEA